METLKQWKEAVKNRDFSILDEILADEVVFHSPVLWTPQIGRDITKLYLFAAMHVIGGDEFKYVKEIVSDNHACLEFTTRINDIVVNGVDIITFDEGGNISEFKVMIRPIRAIMEVKEKMFEMMNTMNG